MLVQELSKVPSSVARRAQVVWDSRISVGPADSVSRVSTTPLAETRLPGLCPRALRVHQPNSPSRNAANAAVPKLEPRNGDGPRITYMAPNTCMGPTNDRRHGHTGKLFRWKFSPQHPARFVVETMLDGYRNDVGHDVEHDVWNHAFPRAVLT